MPFLECYASLSILLVPFNLNFYMRLRVRADRSFEIFRLTRRSGDWLYGPNVVLLKILLAIGHTFVTFLCKNVLIFSKKDVFKTK